MARRLGVQANFLKLHDNLSGTDIELRYRMPTTKERQGYSNKAFVRRGKTVVNQTHEARLDYGLAILTGIRDGDFEVEKDGGWVALASDKTSPHYTPAWKDHVKEHGADLVMLLAAAVFDGSAELRGDDPEADTEHETQEDQSQD